MKTGEKAFDFSLKDQDENTVKLSDFKGQKVLLSFHPLAWTGVCAHQMKDLEENYSSFSVKNTVPLGISIDAVPAKKAWADDLGLENLKILSDFWPHGEVATKFGVFLEDEGFAARANVLIDENGEILFKKVYETGDVPDLDDIFSRLD